MTDSMDKTLAYHLGYAYGYTNLALASRSLLVREGYEDGAGDAQEKALPIADFDCKNHYLREIGTIITIFSNPLVKDSSSMYLNLYVVGDYPELGRNRYRLYRLHSAQTKEWEPFLGSYSFD
jgi:hypothetical protein